MASDFAQLSDRERRDALAKMLLARIQGPERPRPLSYGQQARFELAQSAPRVGLDNMSFGWRIRVPMDTAVLRQALNVLVARYESLRSVFRDYQGVVVRHVLDTVEVPFSDVDVSESADNGAAAVGRETARPFDLGVEPPIRVRLFRRGPADHLLLLTAHHLVVDFWSFSILLPQIGREYLALLQGRGEPASADPRDYDRFVLWQTGLVTGPSGTRALRFWRDQLGEHADFTELPWDRPWPAERGFCDLAHRFTIPDETAVRLKDLASTRGCTLFVVLLTAFELVLTSFSGQKNLVVVCPTAGRTLSEFRDYVGDFTNHLFVRTRIDEGQELFDLLEHVRAAVTAAMEHEAFPFSLVAARVTVPSLPAGAVPFPVRFNMPKVYSVKPQVDGASPAVTVAMGSLHLELESIVRRVTGTCDLHLGLVEAHSGIVASLQYNAEVFDLHTIAAMADRFLRVGHLIATGRRFRVDELVREIQH
jgi:hypothetical protein